MTDVGTSKKNEVSANMVATAQASGIVDTFKKHVEVLTPRASDVQNSKHLSRIFSGTIRTLHSHLEKLPKDSRGEGKMDHARIPPLNFHASENDASTEQPEPELAPPTQNSQRKKKKKKVSEMRRNLSAIEEAKLAQWTLFDKLIDGYCTVSKDRSRHSVDMSVHKYDLKIPMNVFYDAMRTCSPEMAASKYDWNRVMNDWHQVLENLPNAESNFEMVNKAKLNLEEEQLLSQRLPIFTRRILYKSPAKCLYVVRPPTIKRKRKLVVNKNRKMLQAIRPKKLKARALAFRKPNM